MGKCTQCQGKWRYNYPHGKRSKGYAVVLVPHDGDCKYATGLKR